MKESQCKRILEHLRKYGSITAGTAAQGYGIMRLAARISDLREAGHVISSELETGENRFGETTRFAVYKLIKEATTNE